MSLFEDDDFVASVATLLCKDRNFLRKFSRILTPDDFKPRTQDPNASHRWVIATKALEHFETYKEPIGKLLHVELAAYAKTAKLGERRHLQLKGEATKVLKGSVRNCTAIEGKISQFKSQVAKASAIEQILEAQASGTLSDEEWMDICRNAVTLGRKLQFVTTDYLTTLDQRILRRELRMETRHISFFIDPLDELVRNIGRKEFGLVVAPMKRGKSMFLLWLAFAYMSQGLRVLYFTLEDSQEVVEDRLDSLIAQIETMVLKEKVSALTRRFRRFAALIKGRLQLVDATEGGLSVNAMENSYQEHKDKGFAADVVIVDYDDEIVPAKKNTDRRFEFAQIYRDLRQFASREDVYLWTAAQTKRGTRPKKVLTDADVAEDVSKIRKVTLALSLGQGDWGEDSIYVSVMNAKNTREGVGCHILPNKDQSIIYDRRRTFAYIKRLGAEQFKPTETETE